MIKIFRTIILFALAAMLSSCVAATSNSSYSTIRESHDITSKYRSLTIDPEYKYYYSGPKLNPNAIMGLDNDLIVQSKFWHQIDLDKEQLEYWVTWGDRQSRDEGFSKKYIGRFMGAYIFDLQGEVIGDWYSKKDWGIFEFPGNNVIIPHPPKNQDGSAYKRF